jgi:steroid delta-isomerase-like uncharacterized protein
MKKEILIREFIQKVWNEKSFDSIPKYIAREYTIHSDPNDPWEGRTLNFEEFAMRLDYSFDSFTDIHFEIQTAIADGNDVAITWIMTGTNSGKMGAFLPTAKSINATGRTVYHLKNGKVSGHSQVYNQTRILKQLGFNN